jgi:Tol biopolymer transport system component
MRAVTVAIAILASLASAQIQIRPFLDLPGEASDPAISPDGKTLVFAWWTPDDSQWGLYTRPMSGGTPQLFAKGEEGIAVSPRWSPDGQWIAFLRWATPRTASLFVKPAAGGKERRLGSVCNDSVAWTADGVALITPNNGDTDSFEDCRLVVLPLQPGKPSWELAHRGAYPTVSPDGLSLAFVRDREIRLIALTNEGRAAGPETLLVREPLKIFRPRWVPNTRDLLYLMQEDRSVIRRIEARPGAKPRDAGSIDGEFLDLTLSPGGAVLAEVYQHIDSYWRIDLKASDLSFEKIRTLPWNVHNLRLAPDGKSLLYTVYSRGETVFFASNVDGSTAGRLFSVDCERVEGPVWSPDGKQIAFTGEPYVAQISPSYLFVSPVRGPPKRLLPKGDQVHGVNWTPDGKALHFTEQMKNESTFSKLNLVDGTVTRGGALDGNAAQITGGFLYSLTVPGFTLLRTPLAGGAEERLADGVLKFTVGRGEAYLVRQDAKPPSLQGLNLYRVDLAAKATARISNIGFSFDAVQLSPDGRFVYGEKHELPSRHVMLIQGLR